MKNFKNTDKAIKRLLLAKKRNEKIGIWGDYDPDGIPAAFIINKAMLGAGFFKKNLFVILPNSSKYDRSFNPYHLDLLRENHVSLIVGVDFGTTDFQKVRMAKSKGFDVILLDHHLQLPGKLPAILINPKQQGDTYPYKNWSGAGVAYKFFEWFYAELGLSLQILEPLLDACTISMVADGIKRDKENVKYLKRGLRYINQKQRPGLRALLKVARQSRVDKNIMLWGEDIDYIFRVSVSGDHENNNLFKLLSAADAKAADGIASSIAKKVVESKKLIKKNIAAAVKQFKEEGRPNVLFYRVKYPGKGMVSMLSWKLNVLLKTPTFIYKEEEKGLFRGSIRTVYPSGENVVVAMEKVENLLVAFGGHPLAAGFNVKKDNLPAFKKAMNDYFGR